VQTTEEQLTGHFRDISIVVELVLLKSKLNRLLHHENMQLNMYYSNYCII